jgi:hypothetical protein
MLTCILGSQYIPSAEYFAHWLHHRTVLLEAHENFQKRTWRNRTAILSPAEPLSLTVPLQKGKHQQQSIRDVRIAYDEPWVENHIRSLQTAYGKTAFAEEVLQGVFDLLSLRQEKLWDLNLQMMDYLTAMMSGPWKFSITDTYVTSYAPEVFDFRSGIPAGKTNLPTPRVPLYPQVQRLHQAFQPNLTILDVLCHLGPGTIEYLTRYAAQLYPTT